MAKITLKVSSTQTWIHPEISYTQYPPSNKRCSKHHWHMYHSVWANNGARCYQSGNSQTDGKYNGNQLSFMFFRKDRNGVKMRDFISSIGGVGRISKIVLRVTNGHSWYSTGMQANICMTPWWDPEKNWGSGGIEGAPYRDAYYSDLNFTRLTQVQIPKGKRVEIDLTQWKDHFTNGESIALWAPGGYNSNYSAYGWIHGHLASEANQPELDIYYETNSAPYSPTVRIDSPKDPNGFIKPDLSFSVISNGDPDGNIHPSSAYSFDLRDVYGGLIHDHVWTGSGSYNYNLEDRRGQTIKVTGWIRDADNVRTTNSTNVYINSRPRWDGLGAESNSISYQSGVVNGVFKDNITIKWPSAKDAESQHDSNLRYFVYYQKDSDKGPDGDNSSNCIEGSMSGTSLTINAANLVNKGERLYFSVWVFDGLEFSSYRLISSWIYREQPPTKPTNISPSNGHFEKSVNVTWSASSGSNGTSISHYKLYLLNSSKQVVKSYTVNSTSFTCNDIDSIPRGDGFYFRVIAVDSLGNDSNHEDTANMLKRNSAPEKPRLLKIDSDEIYFTDSIPIAWTASIDADNDAIKYNIYYNINNGEYIELLMGTSSLKLTHNVSGIPKGSKINYYVQAYDVFNIYSDKTYISVQPQINQPPESGAILLPVSDRTIYTNEPRIIFSTKKAFSDKKIEVIITINNKAYRSNIDVDLFDKEHYSSNETGMFIVPSDAPLNYSKRNSVSIKVFDQLDYSQNKDYNFSVDSLIVDKITNSGTVITEEYISNIRKMINANRFAYNESEINWNNNFIEAGRTIINKKIFEQMIDGIHSVTVILNDKAKVDRMKRVYNKETLITGSIISKNTTNNIIDMIKKS